MTLPRTPSQTVGPYYAIGLCRRPEHELAPDGETLSGRLLDGEGAPVDGIVELWDGAGGRFARSGTDADGRFAFRVAKPPALGPDAPRLDVLVFARGLLRHQVTRLYFPDETERNAADEVLASLPPDRRETLVASREEEGLRFDIHLQGDRQTVFFAL